MLWRLVEFHLAHRNIQGELEHRRPKAWHIRTNRRDFIKQITRIERRQARIRRIKHKLTARRAQSEDVATSPDAHHHIGSSQKHHEHIPSFLQVHKGDPAIQVCAIFTHSNIANACLELFTQAQGTCTYSSQGLNIAGEPSIG